MDEPAPEKELLSAEVVLRGPAGDPSEAISSSNLARHRPDPTQASAAREWFRRRGFDTTDVHGISFTVTGPRRLFEEACMTRLDGDGARPGVDVLELPLPTDMPTDVAEAVAAVTFSPPPDFGSGSY